MTSDIIEYVGLYHDIHRGRIVTSSNHEPRELAYVCNCDDCDGEFPESLQGMERVDVVELPDPVRDEVYDEYIEEGPEPIVSALQAAREEHLQGDVV